MNSCLLITLFTVIFIINSVSNLFPSIVSRIVVRVTLSFFSVFLFPLSDLPSRLFLEKKIKVGNIEKRQKQKRILPGHIQLLNSYSRQDEYKGEGAEKDGQIHKQ